MTTSSLPPSNTFLEITIISAKHLKNVNWRTGPLKPYCIFWLDSNRRLATKSDDSGSTKPVWNERFALPLNLSPQDSLLTLEIFHSKPSETPKPLIGTVFIQIRDLVNYEKSTMIKCFEVQRPSGRPQGKIMIKLALIDRSVCNYQSALQQSFANCQITPPGCFYYSSAPPPPPSTKEYKGYGFAAASPSPPSATRDYKGDYERYIFSGEAPPPSASQDYKGYGFSGEAPPPPPPSSARDYKGYSFPAARPPPPPPSSTREFKGYNLSVDSLPSPPRPPLPPHYSTRDDKGYYFPSETPPSFPSQAPPYQYGGGYSDGYSSYYQGYYPQQQAEAVRQSLERQASYGGPGPSAPVDYTSSLDQKRGGSVGVAGALGGLALDEEIKYEEDRITEIEENHALEKEFVQKLPDARDQRTGVISLGKNEIRAPLKDLQKPGKFCEMLIDMLPEHLAFTIFCPSEKAFKRDLRLRWNDSLLEENKEDDDTYAILTRILGFSTVPRSIFSGDLVYGNEVNYDSLSGHVLYIWKDMKGGFVVNRVKSEVMDLKRGKTVVHLMDGVIMTPDFEEAMKPDDDDADQETEEANN